MKSKPTRKEPFLFEELEPRVLFSADLIPGLGDLEPLDESALEDIAREATLHEHTIAADVSPAAPASSPDLSEAEHRAELVFIDANTPESEQLLNNLLTQSIDGRPMDVVVLDAERDGIAQMTEILSSYDNLDAVHIVSHGNETGVQLGATFLELGNLAEHSSDIESWRSALSNEADLLFYGCDLAGGESGRALIGGLAGLTGADVAASDDPTGSALLGGDWDLEYHAGGIEAAVAFTESVQQTWVGTLDYVQSAQSVSPTTAGVWEVQDLSGLGIPADAVIEIAVANSETSLQTGGVRAVGSALDRSFLLEPLFSAGEGAETTVMHVQADASAQIETFGSDLGAISFKVLGYWDHGTYVEAFDTFNLGNGGQWDPVNLSTYGVGAGDVAEIAMVNDTSGLGTEQAGVRENGSSLERKLSIDDGGFIGANGAHIESLLVRADESPGATIEAFASDETVIDFVLLGYWSDAPGAYTEVFADIGSPSSSATWESKDLSGFGVPANALADITLSQEDTPDGWLMGARETGSTDTRSLDLRGSHGGITSRMQVQTDGASTIEWFHEDIAQPHRFLLTGYWDDAPVIDLDQGSAGEDFSATFTVDGGSVALSDADATVTSFHGTTLDSLTVTITNLQDGDREVLTADTSGTSINAAYAGGVLTLTGTDSVANYEQVLRTITYDNTTADPGTTARQVTFVADDGVDTGNLATATVSVVHKAHALWLSTEADVASPSGAPGLDSWSDSQALEFGGPGLTLEPGTTTGSFSSLFDIDSFAASATDITALHFVTRDLTVGGANSIDLKAGDVLFGLSNNQTLTSNNTLAVESKDIIVFRPQKPGDFSAGTFIHLLDDPIGNNVTGMSLVEKDTTVGGTLLQAGTFLLARNSDEIEHFTADNVGTTTTSGTTSLLIDGADIGLNQNITGVELIEDAIRVGGVTLQPGQILLTLAADDATVGNNVISANEQDVFFLDVTQAGVNTIADATLLFQGADVGLDTGSEDLNALSLVAEVNPVANDDAFNAVAGTPLVVSAPDGVLRNDGDPNRAPVTASLVADAANGNVVLNPDGSFTYTPDAGFTGTDTFTYNVNDATFDSEPATVTLVVRSAVTGQSLLFATQDDVNSPSGAPGLDSWTKGHVLEFGDSSLALEPGVTDGAFSALIDLGSFAADSTASISAIHYVRDAITVGSANAVNLLAGDVLLSVNQDETLTSTNSLAVTKNDVFVFRPDTPGDYSSGTFTMLLNDPVGAQIRAISLVEQDTVVGNSMLSEGTFLFVTSGGAVDDDIRVFSADDVGTGTTSGTDTVLVNGDDIGFAGKQIHGVELLENRTTLGGTPLDAGTLLVTIHTEGTVGDNSLAVTRQDVFALDVKRTSLVGETSEADATLLFEGADVGLDTNPEDIRGIALVATPPPVASNDAYSVDEDNTLTVDWWNTDWTARQQLTFNNTAQASDLDEFPVLVVLNSSNIDYAKTQNNGEDLRFFDPDGTALAFEIETWNESGDSHVWVKVPRIDAASGTDHIWMYYGNAAAADAQDPDAVWSSGYTGVYHLDEDPALTAGVLSDSAGAPALDGTNQGSTDAAGAIGQGQSFDAASSEYIDLGSDRNFVNGASQVTVSAWINPNSVAGTAQMLSLSIDGGGPSNTSRIGIERNGDEIEVFARSSDAAGDMSAVTTTDVNLNPGTWYHITGVIDYAADTISVYVNGVLRSTTGTVDFLNAAAPNTNSSSAAIGSEDTGSSGHFDGLMDEVRIATVKRSADWVAAQQLSQGNTFVSLGGEETAPAISGVVQNDSDPDDDPLTVSLVNGPANAASFTLNKDGTFTYTPTADFNGVDTFTYTVNDGYSDSNVATVTLTVNAINDDPGVAANTGLTLTEGATGTITSAKLGVSDVDNTPSELTYTMTTSPTNGQLELTGNPGLAITSFTQDDIDNNRVVYVHDHSNTTSDSFDFDVDDTFGAGPAGQTFSITVTPVDDDAPTQTTNAGSTVAEGGTDTLISAEVLYTDSEQPATSVTYTVTTVPSNGQLELTAVPGVAITSFTQDDIDNNRVVYVHDHSNTTSDSFDFDVDDGQGNTLAGQSFSITVTPVDDDAPTQTTNAGSTVAEGGTDTLISAEVLYTDSEQPATSVTYTVTTSPVNGQLELTAVPGVAITSFTQDDIDNNRVVYVHDHSNTTSDSFDFDVDDGQGNTLSAQSFSITVTPVDDDAPTQTTNAGSTVAEGGTDTLISAEVLYTDSEQPATSVTYTVTTSPVNGQLELTAVPGVAITSFTQDDIDNNRVVYVHDHSNTTSDSFDFDVDDGQGNTLSAQSFSITVTPVDDDAPTQTTNAGSTVAEGGTDTLISAEVLYTDSEQPATSVTYTVTTSPVNGQLELTAVPGVAITSFTQDDIDNNRVVYVHDHSNTTSDSFDFDVDDGQGNTLSAQSFSITVTPVDDDAPTQTTNAGSTVAEGGTDTLISAEVLYTDSEQPATSVTYTVTTVPSNGQLELTAVPGVAITSFTQDDIDNNRVVYVHDHSNTTSDAFDFDVDDGQGNTLAGQSFSITVTPVDDDAPTQTTNAGSTVAEGGTDTLISAEVLYTDSEQPATSVTYTVTTSPVNGQLELTAVPGVAITSFTQDDIDNNRVVYVHDHSNTTSDSFDFDVDDGQGNTLAGQSFSITVTPVDDDAPTQTTNAGSTVAEGGTDTLISAEVLYTDSEQPATSVTYTVTTVPSNGQLELTAVPGVAITSFTQDDIDNNRVVYIHDHSNTTSDSFDFDVDDGQGNTLSAQSFSITVTPVDDDAPTQTTNAGSTVAEGGTDTLISAEVLYTDSEQPATSVTYTVTTSPVNGQLELTAVPGVAITSFTQDDIDNNRVVYVHDHSNTTSDSFDFDVDDGQGNTLAGQSFSITVTPVDDDAPTQTTNAGSTVAEGGTDTLISAEVLYTDSEQPATSVTYTVTTSPANGQLELTAVPGVAITSFTQDDIDNNRVVYVHDHSNTTSDAFDFDVDDGQGNTLAGQSFSITVTPVDDDAPTQTTNAGSTVAEGGTDTLISAEVLYTDSEQPATSVTYTVTTVPSNGQLELTGNPGVAITSFTQDDIDNNRVVYVHDHSNTTSDSFDFNVDDGQGNTLAGQSFSITVTPVDDDAPTQTTNAGSTVAEGGTDTLISAEVLYTDSEQPATSVTYTVTTSPANGQLELTAVPGVAITSFTQDDIDNNRVVYIHDHSNTTSDSFDFDVDDGQGNTLAGQSFSITVTPVDDDAPTQTTNAGSTVAEGGTDTLISAEVLYTDSEQPATSVTYTVTTAPANGQLELTGNPGVAITSFTQDDIDNNRVVYLHDHSNTTSDAFDFDVDDGQGNTLAGQSFSITVTPVDDDAPTQTTNAGSTVAEGGTDTLISAEVLYTDSEQPATSVTYTVTTSPANGQLELTGNPGVAITSFTQDDIDNNRVVYVHDHSNTTSDSFDFNVDDGQGNTLAGQSFSITVTPVDDDAPTQTTNAGSTVAEGGTDTLISAELLYTDSEQPATSVTYTVTTSPANGQLELTAVPGVAITSFTQDDIDNNRVVYIHDHSNTTSDAFDFDVDDGQGNTLSGQSFSITVTPVDDDAPTQTTNAGSTVAEGGTDTLISAELLYTDSEQPATSVTYTVTTSPTNGQLELTAVPGVAITSFTQDDIDNNRVVYVHDHSNTTSDSFDFDVDDGQGNTLAGQSFSITVTPVDDDAPAQTTNAGSTVAEGGTDTLISAEVLYTDSEQPATSVTYTVTTVPSNGQLELTAVPGVAITSFTQDDIDNNRVVYVHDHSNTTSDSFDFNVDDGQGNTLAGQSFSITVTPVDDDAPTQTTNAGSTVAEGGTDTLISAELLYTDSEQPATSVTYTVTTSPANGQLELTAVPGVAITSFTQDDIDNNRVVYIHDHSNTTSDSFDFDVDDGQGNTLAGQSFSITVTPVDDDAPTQTTSAGSTVAEGGTDTLISAELLYTDSEQPATSVTYTVTTVPANGQLELTAVPGVAITSFTQDDIDNNRVVYVHDSSNTTSDSFDFNVDDGQGNFTLGQSFAITVTPVNDLPTTSGFANVTVNEDASPSTLSVFGAFDDSEDPDPALAYTLTANTNPALFSSTPIDGAAGTLTLNYAANANGSANITVRATDTAGAFVETTFNVTLNPVNDAPTLSANAGLSLDQGDSLTLANATLAVSDIDNNAAQIAYTLSALPAHGSLELNGSALGLGGRFTQDDIDNGRLAYAHAGAPSTSDTFTFSVDDGAGGTLGPISFSVTIEPTPELPSPPPVDPPPDPGDVPDPDPVDLDEPVEEPEEPAPEEPRAPPGDATGLEDLDPLSTPTEGFVLPGLSPSEDADTPERQRASAPLAPPAPPADLTRPAAEPDQVPATDSEPSADIDNEVSALSLALDEMQNQMDEAVELEEVHHEMLLNAARGGGIALTAGYLSWLFRAGTLLASALSTMPVWTKFDPLPILAAPKRRRAAYPARNIEDEEDADRAVDQMLEGTKSRRFRS